MENKIHSSAASHIVNCGAVIFGLSLLGSIFLVISGLSNENWMAAIIGIFPFAMGCFTYRFCQGFAELCEEIVRIRVNLEMRTPDSTQSESGK